ncbi:MAG: c-type cytochrome domain-containing protein [Bythopirellula sp.]|nr:c-type cytochrome domain-containing protein [Bythopirellula sp.]
MNRQLFFCIALLLQTSAQAAVDFQKEILPIFEANCVKCHNAEKAMGKLKLNSAEGIQEKWTDDDHLLVKGDPEKSELYERLVLPADNKKRMPKGGDPLDKASIDLIAAWIKEGAVLTVASTAPATEAVEPTAVPAAETPSTPAVPELEPLPLPEVPAAPQEAVDRLIAAGGKVMNLYSGSNLLEVTFVLAPQPPTDDTLKLLVDVAPQVVMLNLKKATATDEGWSVLAELPNLRVLNVQDSSFSDEAAKNLAGLERLESLNLYGTSVTDAALEPLGGLKRLRKLYLWKTHVTYDGVVALEKGMPGLEWNLGWDHPEVARQRLVTQQTEFKELLNKAAADAERLKADLKVAEETHVAAEKRLKEVEESLSKLTSEKSAEPGKTEAKSE